ncbi:hypothetical protein BDB00DRAFT_870889 [Zychaea mexicana]|uniref:uncharacterized protein n=1 Tax=Zychaea mexicana TaxID=64656 RepID=UPI0022FDCE58|nr:uncharacterized protein BDB00DRAFT_870889 [Zychaea mexicana]KAI9494895.1 hypothetical protein BDB00DRAFT_870889 [Zychaea mexicana]
MVSSCFSPLCMHYVKHAQLIKNCYPTKEGEKGPRSSELSYLTFYASSRPAKLTKVGSYLEKKVERDIAKGRKQNNQVSLDIVKALIQSCHRDLNLFSKWVVRILNKILDTREIELEDLACETFVIFCNYHDGSTLGIDPGLTGDFEGLLRKFAEFCNYTNADEDLTLKMQYIGHRAMQAAVTSNAFHGPDFKAQLDIVLPALLKSLITSGNADNRLEKGQGSIDIKQSIISKGEPVESTAIEALAAQTTGILFSKSNGSAVRSALVLVFQFAEDKEQWWPPDRIVSIMELILDSVQAQYRYLLISETLQQLESSNASEPAYLNSKHASLVSILDTVLNAVNAPLLGVSVLEVLNSLFTLLIKTLHVTTVLREALPEEERVNQQVLYEYAIHRGILHSFGGLASQQYYQNQLDDMTGYLIAKLRASTTLETVDGIPISLYRHVVLVCLDNITLAHKALTPTSDKSIHSGRRPPSEIPLEDRVSAGSWTAGVGLLTDKNPETRSDFARSLVQCLETTTPIQDPIIGGYPLHLLLNHSDIVFVNTVSHTIVEWVQQSGFDAADAYALYTILCALTRRFGIDATLKTVPLVFKLQSMVQDGTFKGPARQSAIAAVAVAWLTMVGKFYRVDDLVEYTERIQQERERSSQWYEVTVLPENRQFVEHSHPTPVNAFLDRHVIVASLSSKLRDEQDTHGLELESKLYAEWGSEALLSHEQSMRIRASNDINGQKPRLSNPWSSHEPSKRGSLKKKDSIKVENLKEALAQPQQKAESSSASDSTSTSIQITPSRKSSINPMRKTDINALLTELDIGPNAQK